MHDNWLNKQENILKEIDQLIKNINTKNRDLSKINESWEYNFPYILYLIILNYFTPYYITTLVISYILC